MSRLAEVRAVMRNCLLCHHHCGVDRSSGQRGRCQAGEEVHYFSAQMEATDEMDFVPSYEIALGGCDLRCVFCNTARESWNAKGGLKFEIHTMEGKILRAIEEGARSVMVLGGEPTIHLPAVLQIASVVPDEVPLIYKTNGHFSTSAQALLEGVPDIWLVDYKFGNDDCARRLAGVEHYSFILKENLQWCASQGRLVIRHLLMPGHEICCWEPVAAWISEYLPGVAVSLRTGFWPLFGNKKYGELGRVTTGDEQSQAHETARRFGLTLIR